MIWNRIVLVTVITAITVFPWGSHVFAISTQFEINPQLLDRMAVIPEKEAKAAKGAKAVRPPKGRAVKTAGKRRGRLPASPDQTTGSGFRLVYSTPETRTSGIEAARLTWDRIFPELVPPDTGLEISGDNFSLSIDPGSFPVLPAADGGRILIDAGGKLPQLVRNLIQYQDDRTRIVSEDPVNRKRFFASLLEAGGFFSVNENFRATFGEDPQLIVTSDFKVEKTKDSLNRNDMLLVNVSEAKTGMPSSLASFLSRQGFSVVEPYPSTLRVASAGHRLHQITATTASDIADSLLNSLDINYSRDSRVELFGPRDGGLRLDLRADRLFEVGGDRFLISRFSGDPVSYTLLRIMETRGYKVIILEEGDDFRRVADKFLSRMRIPGGFGKHSLVQDYDRAYNVRLSGYMLHSAGSGKRIMLTDRRLDPLISELATLNGYSVIPPQE